MTALHRVKAYFGMVPADELDAYDGYEAYDGYDPYDSYGNRGYEADRRRHGERYDAERYDGDRHEAGRAHEPSAPRRDRYGDRYERADRYDADRNADRYDDRHDAGRRPVSALRSESRKDDTDDDGAQAPRPRDPRDTPVTDSRREEPDMESSRSSRGRSWASNTGPNHTSVRSSSGSRGVPSLTPVGSSGGPGTAGTATRGSLAVDAPPASTASAAPVAPVAPEADPATAPAEITSLQPTSYNEARVIGERYRDGIPVIMNLTDMDEVAAKRLVDFAAGLAFALRGSIEKVTNRVFLLSPPNVEVSAAERRKLAENSYSASS